MISDSAAAPTAMRAAAPNDCPELANAARADVVRADAVPGATAAAGAAAAASASAAANATPATRVNWCQLAGSLIALSPPKLLPPNHWR